jgi:hypothetical protein
MLYRVSFENHISGAKYYWQRSRGRTLCQGFKLEVLEFTGEKKIIGSKCKIYVCVFAFFYSSKVQLNPHKWPSSAPEKIKNLPTLSMSRTIILMVTFSGVLSLARFFFHPQNLFKRFESCFTRTNIISLYKDINMTHSIIIVEFVYKHYIRVILFDELFNINMDKSVEIQIF